MNCNYCGQEHVAIVNEDGTGMCIKCLEIAGTCNLCESGSLCDFETNPSPLPKQVQKTIRHENMIIQTVINNPDRIRECCQAGCPCFDPEFFCLKQIGTCARYKEIEPKL